MADTAAGARFPKLLTTFGAGSFEVGLGLDGQETLGLGPIGSVVAGFGFGLMNREPFWATAVLLLAGAALSGGMPLLSTRPAAKMP